MASIFFPKERFKQALSVTNKLKAKMELFIRQVQNRNIQWTFIICSELYQYLNANDADTIYKFNSLATIKLLIQTCQFPIFLITEVYFLPLIQKIASYQLILNQKIRGLDYFPPNQSIKIQYVKKLGYNFVRLACEMISILSVVKPYKVYKNQQIPTPSEFSIALESMLNKNWNQYDSLAFFVQNPLEVRQKFLEKMQIFTKNTHNYENFIRVCFDNIIRKDMHPVGLDVRKILQFYEPFACKYAFESLRQMSRQKDVVTLTNVLMMTTDFVKWGNIQAYYLIEVEELFSEYFEMLIDENNSFDESQRTSIFDELQGTFEQRKIFYRELLQSLQVWTACIAQDLLDPSKESKVTSTYKKLKHEKKVSFPYLGNLKKVRNQSSSNLQKFKILNQMSIKKTEINKSYSKTFIRRDSVELKQLINFDSQNMKSLIKESRSAKKTKFKEEQDDSILDQSQYSKENQTERVGKLKINKASSFANTFFRQKKKRINRTNDLDRFTQTLTLTSNSLGNTFNQLRSSTSTFDIEKRLNKNRMKLQTVPSMDQVQKDEPISSSDDDILDTNYSEQLEEEMIVGDIKSLRKAQTYSNYVEKPGTKQESTIMQFFDQSDWSVSSIASSGNGSRRVSRQPKIQIFQPQINHEHKDKDHFLKDKSSCNLTSQNSEQFNVTIENYIQLEEKVSCLEAQKFYLKNELETKEKQIENLKKNQNKSQDSSICSWSKVLNSNSSIKNNNIKENSSGIHQESKMVKCEPTDKFHQEINDLKKIYPKKLLKKKDLLLKTDKIQLGYILQNCGRNVQIIIFVTPSKNIANINYQISKQENIIFIENSEKILVIEKNKQKKLRFIIKIKKAPYFLPHFKISYEAQGQKYNHTITLPLSYNKFIIFDHEWILISNPLIKKSKVGLLNKKQCKSFSNIQDYLSDLSYKKTDFSREELFGNIILENIRIGIRILCKEQQYIQVECIMKEKDRQLTNQVEFFISTIFSILTK